MKFQEVVTAILNDHPELRACEATVEKEVLQQDILFAMRECGMLEQWVFKGGTCLRLCHGGVRLCEDMDFSPVREGIDPFQYLNLERILQARLRRHYSITEVSVSTQRVASQSNHPIDRFLMRIVTQPSPSGSTVKTKCNASNSTCTVDLYQIHIRFRYDFHISLRTLWTRKYRSVLSLLTKHLEIKR